MAKQSKWLKHLIGLEKRNSRKGKYGYLKFADTWHHGLVARWWAEFKLEGPEIDYFKNAIQRSGNPALDIGCNKELDICLQLKSKR